jgi:DNA polymerase III alpha subunit
MRTENEAIEVLYQSRSLRDEPLELTADILKFFEFGEQLEVDMPVPLTEETFSSDYWDIPDNYKELDIESLIMSKTQTPEEKERVEMELKEFHARNMMPSLRALLYIVDVMRDNDIVWGVGRGSSVASFCLYLLGVHRINSLKYNLDFKEFLK